jgi:hypothetical protein
VNGSPIGSLIGSLIGSHSRAVPSPLAERDVVDVDEHLGLGARMRSNLLLTDPAA